MTYSDDPLHVGMRQYWRDFESLEAWSLALPHKQWWTDYLRDGGGTSFWHETYFRRGGFESMYVAVDEPVGMARFAPSARPQGPMFSARQRRDADRSSAVRGNTPGACQGVSQLAAASQRCQGCIAQGAERFHRAAGVDGVTCRLS